VDERGGAVGAAGAAGPAGASAAPSPRLPRGTLQIDGSDHEWFEDRGPRCTLLVYIDDATSELMALRFGPSESAFEYFAATHVDGVRNPRKSGE